MEYLYLIILTILLVETSYLVYAANGKQKPASKQTRPVFIDTSVLIDGRIMSVVDSGFLSSDKLYVPRSVVRELQLIADSSDSEKRQKARRGLDNLAVLLESQVASFEIFSDETEAREGVDERLISLAKKHHGSICTIDYNLNKVASVEKIAVLNINDLAMNLRMSYLPGDKFLIELNQKGTESSQAVGHLSDGTMVVVDNARKYIGSIREVETTRSLQTAAGRMIFARIVFEKKHASKTPKPHGQSPVKNPSGEDKLVYLANR